MLQKGGVKANPNPNPNPSVGIYLLMNIDVPYTVIE